MRCLADKKRRCVIFVRATSRGLLEIYFILCVMMSSGMPLSLFTSLLFKDDGDIIFYR